MKIFLSDRIGGPGLMSGYDQLVEATADLTMLTVIRQRSGMIDRMVGKAYSLVHGWEYRNQHHSASEFRLSLRFPKRSVDFAHILVGEYHLPYIARWRKAPPKLVATLHFPPAQWEPEMRVRLRSLDSALVLYRRDIPFFEEHVGEGRVMFVPHGVRTDFFKPGDSPRPAVPRILFAGQYLRDTEMLFRVITLLHARHPDLRFDLLVPGRDRTRPGLVELNGHPAVEWHSGLDDTQMREKYRNAHVLMVPMLDSGANNAIVEALACGTPVVTTDVGGIRDYGGGRVFPVVPAGDDEGMVSLVEDYLNDPSRRDAVGAACRKFAETDLAWPVAAQKHLEACQTLAQS